MVSHLSLPCGTQTVKLYPCSFPWKVTLEGVTGTIPVWPSVSLWLPLLSKWQRSGGRANDYFKWKRDLEKCVTVGYGSGFGWRCPVEVCWAQDSLSKNLYFFGLTLWSLTNVSFFSSMMVLWGRLRTVTEAQREKDRAKKGERRRRHQGSRSSQLLKQGQLCQTFITCLRQYKWDRRRWVEKGWGRDEKGRTVCGLLRKDKCT